MTVAMLSAANDASSDFIQNQEEENKINIVAELQNQEEVKEDHNVKSPPNSNKEERKEDQLEDEERKVRDQTLYQQY